MDVSQLGSKLADYRRSNNITIKDFSKRSGISTALLSQLERGLGNPSLSVITSIARTMNLSVSSLFKESFTLESLVRRVDEQPTIIDTCKSNLEFQLLTAGGKSSEFDLYRVKIRAKTETVYYPLSDLNSEKIILVEKGDLSICNNQGGEVVLNAGDSMRLVSDYRYKIKNPSTQDTSALYFVSSHKDIFKKRIL